MVTAARSAGTPTRAHHRRCAVAQLLTMKWHGVPMRPWGTPDDVGRTVAALAPGRLPFATGNVVRVGGGLHTHRG